jgi:hypothetical protein
VVLRCEARGFSFDIRGDAALKGILTELFAPLERRAGTAAAAVFAVARESGEGSPWHVDMDGQPMMGAGQLGEALHGLMVHINQRVVSARDDVMSLHAAAVATSDGAVVLPGASGSGKTTLCARLLQRGAAYLSDDSIGLDRQVRVLGYPKPLGFKGATWEDFAGPALADLDFDRGRRDVWQVPASRLGASSVQAADPVAVVLPRFVPHAPLSVEPVPRHAMSAALLGQVQNLRAFGASNALDVIGRLVTRVSCHAVVYGDASEAAPVVLELARSVSGEAGRYDVATMEATTAGVSAPIPAADVVALRFDDGALLVRGESGEFATVDRTGALIWPLLDGQQTPADIAAELAPRFGVASFEIEDDVARWINELTEKGFLRTPGPF